MDDQGTTPAEEAEEKSPYGRVKRQNKYANTAQTIGIAGNVVGVIMALLSLSVALSAASAFKGSAKTMTFIAAFDFSWVIVILLSVGLYCFSEVIESLDKVSKKEHQE